ncbi:MAG: MoaD/ThiS family protein [Burkholderiales bacterium]|nr:MAG: MoaD/ThiS family protein [Burkholderiales bacterium]
MRIKFKLYAMLADHMPLEVGSNRRNGNEIWLDVEEGATVQAVIDRFHLPTQLVHLVLVDGAFVKPEHRSMRALAEGETLAIWPPVAGG